MGQIDHARNRIHELCQLKMTDYPEQDSTYWDDNYDGFKRDLQNGDFIPTPSQLNKAFGLLISDYRIPYLKRERQYYQDPHKTRLDDISPGDIYQALFILLHEKNLVSETKVFEKKLAEFNRKKKIIKDKAAEVEDFIVLGDVHTALQALKDFEKFEVA